MDLVTVAFPYGEFVTWHLPEKSPVFPVDPLKGWLLDKGSLTQNLKSCCQHFEVKVLGEGLVFPETGKWDFDEPFWEREVLLCLDGVAWIFARTLIPNMLMIQTDNSFKNLGNRPLGELLFNNDKFIPDVLEIACFNSCSKLAGLANSLSQAVVEPLWGRRRHFHHDDQKLIVSEVFLPAAVKNISNLSFEMGLKQCQ